MEAYGIDVSEYQGAIDWESVKAAGKQFAIIRCGYGSLLSQKDPRFEANYSGAKATGINVGAYLFSYATTVEQARSEAANCLEIIRGKQFEYPIVYDVETSAQQNLGRTRLSQVVNAFCEAVEAAGYYVTVYANLNFIRNYFDETVLSRYDLWLAQWASAPSYTNNVGMWQYSATGRVNGIVGDVDLDKSFKDYPSIIQAAGLNGFSDIPTQGNPIVCQELTAGQPLVLNSAPLYSTSTSRRPSTYIRGTYYIYDGKPVNCRYRITNSKWKVGRFPYFLFVTGWINRESV